MNCYGAFGFAEIFSSSCFYSRKTFISQGTQIHQTLVAVKKRFLYKQIAGLFYR